MVFENHRSSASDFMKTKFANYARERTQNMKRCTLFGNCRCIYSYYLKLRLNVNSTLAVYTQITRST